MGLFFYSVQWHFSNFPHGLKHVIYRRLFTSQPIRFHVKDLADETVTNHLDINETLFSRECLWFVKNILVLWFNQM